MGQDISSFRKSLHSLAERSHAESRTAQRIYESLKSLQPTHLFSDLGGHGVLAGFSAATHPDSPQVLFRCELDAIPTPDGAAHHCGHDGHMTMLIGLARSLQQTPVPSGTVWLLFQPAEETGEGAARVLASDAMKKLQPNQVFAIHNLPGFPLGTVIARDGPFAMASQGLILRARGTSSHAAEPEKGNSPVPAMAALMKSLPVLSLPGRPGHCTVIHVSIGEPAFGMTPSEAVLMATLRAGTNTDIRELESLILGEWKKQGEKYGLTLSHERADPFPATINSPEAMKLVRTCACELEMPVLEKSTPFAWSEDFGHFTETCSGALVGLGSGEAQPPLHHPDFEFPDALLAPGIRLLERIARTITGDTGGKDSV